MSMERVTRRTASGGSAGADAEVGLAERLVALVMEARRAPDPERPGLAGAINAMMARLPSEAGAGQCASLLHRLLEDGHLEGLEDEAGVPSRFAATRVLLGLGYPHALEVPPERLEALRRWERRPVSVPWVAILGVLFLAFMVQVILITMNDSPRRFALLASALAGEAAPAKPTDLELLKDILWDTGYLVFGVQVLGSFLAFVLTVAVGWHPLARPWVRRAFLGLGAVGLLVGCLQLLAGTALGLNTLVSAAGALFAARLLNARGAAPRGLRP